METKVENGKCPKCGNTLSMAGHCWTCIAVEETKKEQVYRAAEGCSKLSMPHDSIDENLFYEDLLFDAAIRIAQSLAATEQRDYLVDSSYRIAEQLLAIHKSRVAKIKEETK